VPALNNRWFGLSQSHTWCGDSGPIFRRFGIATIDEALPRLHTLHVNHIDLFDTFPWTDFCNVLLPRLRSFRVEGGYATWRWNHREDELAPTAVASDRLPCLKDLQWWGSAGWNFSRGSLRKLPHAFMGAQPMTLTTWSGSLDAWLRAFPCPEPGIAHSPLARVGALRVVSSANTEHRRQHCRHVPVWWWLRLELAPATASRRRETVWSGGVALIGGRDSRARPLAMARPDPTAAACSRLRQATEIVKQRHAELLRHASALGIDVVPRPADCPWWPPTAHCLFAEVIHDARFMSHYYVVDAVRTLAYAERARVLAVVAWLRGVGPRGGRCHPSKRL
jgi:hypothetical protein